MNLRKAGGTAQTSRASGFLATEACTPRGVATHLGKHWLKRAFRHHEQSRELKLWNIVRVLGSGSRFWGSQCSGFWVPGSAFAVLHRRAWTRNSEDGPDSDAIRTRSSRRSSSPARSASSPVRACVDVAAAEQLVGDVERGEHRQAQRVAGRRRVGGGAHLLVDVARQPRDVLRIERAADRVALPVDLDRRRPLRQPSV